LQKTEKGSEKNKVYALFVKSGEENPDIAQESESVIENFHKFHVFYNLLIILNL